MKKGLCEIIVVADRSGSMEVIKNDAIGAFNNFLEEQRKAPGEALLTYAQFDDAYDIVHLGVPIKDVPKLNHSTYSPRGSTALLDAVGRTIDEVGKHLSDTPENRRPERVVFVILTDGQENSSKIFSRIQIFDKIKLQREAYKWEFLFLAAGPDAFEEAAAIGMLQNQTYQYAQGSGHAHNASVTLMSRCVADYRAGDKPIINP